MILTSTSSAKLRSSLEQARYIRGGEGRTNPKKSKNPILPRNPHFGFLGFLGFLSNISLKSYHEIAILGLGFFVFFGLDPPPYYNKL